MTPGYWLWNLLSNWYSWFAPFGDVKKFGGQMNAEIKDSALPVAAYIRSKVPRPGELPTPSPKNILSWPAKVGRKDPLGLIPKALTGWPTGVKDFRGGVPFVQHEMIAFYKWWDKQEDALSAVDAVWGSKKED